MNNFIKFLIFVMVFTSSLGLLIPTDVDASGRVVVIGAGSSPSVSSFSYPVLNQSDAEAAANTANQDIYVQYQTSGDEYASDDSVTITASAGLTLVGDCGSPTTDADGDSTNDISYTSTSGQSHTFYFGDSGNGTTTAATSVEFCVRITTVASGNYSLLLSDSKAAGNEDFGAALLYVGNDNDVVVTAQVLSELEFRIRNNADTADTNSCALGTLSTSTTGSCSYRLKVITNASSGYTISWTRDGPLDVTSGGAGGVDIDAIAETDGTITQGAEEYGVAFQARGTTTGYTCAENGIWDDDWSPVSTTPQNLMTCNAPNAPDSTGDTDDTSLMTHNATIAATTNTGNYEQVVTYYVTGNF